MSGYGLTYRSTTRDPNFTASEYVTISIFMYFTLYLFSLEFVSLRKKEKILHYYSS